MRKQWYMLKKYWKYILAVFLLFGITVITAIIPSSVLADSVNLYAIVGAGTAISGTAVITGSPLRVYVLTPSSQTITVTTTTTNRTFTITMCAGSSCVLTSGTATISSSPKTCSAGTTTTVTVTNTITNGTFTAVITYATTGNWNSAYSWSSVSGGTPNNHAVPTSSNPVFFDANSFTGSGQTFTANNGSDVCAGMNWTGATNTPNFAITAALSCSGSVTFIGASMTMSGTAVLTMGSIAGTNTFNSGGLTLSCPVTINDALGTVQLVTNGLNIGAQTFTLTAGIFKTNNLPLTTTGIINISGANGTFDMSGGTGSIVTCATWTATTTTNLTLTVDSNSKLVITGSTTFNGGGLTYNEVDFNGSSTTTIVGNNHFASFVLPSATTQTIKFTDGSNQTVTTATLNGSSGHVHTLTGTSTAGWTITCTSGTYTYSYLTIQYSTITGGATFNADLTCTNSDPALNIGWVWLPDYWVGGTGTWDNSTTTHWASSSGGTGGTGIVPLNTTDVVFDLHSFSGIGQKVTVGNNSVCKSLNWTGSDNSGTTNPIFHLNAITLNVAGNVTFIANMSLEASDPSSSVLSINNGNSGTSWGTPTLTTAGLTVPFSLMFNTAYSPQLVLLAGNVNHTGTNFQISAGALNTQGYAVTTTGTFLCSLSATTLTMSNSTITCATWTGTTAAGFGITSNGSSKIVVTGATTFAGGGKSYPKVDFNGSGTTTITGSNTFTSIVLPSGTTQTIAFTASTTTTVTNATLSGSNGYVHTLQGATAADWNLAKSGDGTIWADWVTIVHSVASPANTWYYGANSTYTSTSGWAEAVLPTITLSAASSVATTTATLNGNITNLNSSSVNSTVTMYYGTSDGLKVAGSWTYNVAPTSPAQPQGVAAFYYNASSLNPSTLYYFSASATNPAGTVWVTASLNFTTSSSIDISNDPSSKDFGVIQPSSTYYAKGSAPNNPVVDGDCTFTITNNVASAVKININMTNFTGGGGWILTTGAPDGTHTRVIAYYSGQNPASGVKLTTGDQVFIASLAGSATIKWDFSWETPTSFADGVQKSSTITLTGLSP